MQDKAVYIVGLIAAVAAVLTVTTVFHNARVAWILCAILLLGLAITIPMYFVRGRKQQVTPGAGGHVSPPSAPIIGPLIAAYDESLVLGNEATVNYYSAPLTPERPEGESPDE
jgi:hypothetical protein